MTAASDVARTPGWYGKLPSLGDFASRRLEADFVEPWDVWLGEGLQAQREALGEGWLEAYLQSPPWRFVLAPGALAGFDARLVVVGVLVPSVDRVGRYFPLTLASTMTRLPSSNAAYEALLGWLHGLEDIALDALQDDWTIEQLEEALGALSPPPHAAESAVDRLATVRAALADAMHGQGGFVDVAALNSRGDLASLLATAGEPARGSAVIAAAPLPARVALWVADNPQHPRLLVCKGLPAIDDFIGMFSGKGDGAGHALAVAAPAFAAPARVVEAAALPMLAATELETLPMPLSMYDETAAFLDALRPASSTVDAAPGPAPAPASTNAFHDDPLAAAGVAAERSDILSMFGAADAPQPPERVLPEATKDDDILALFDVSADPEAAAAELERLPGKPDILDLFGASPDTPDHDLPKSDKAP